MNYLDISAALRRDDLTVPESSVDIWETIDSPWSRGSLDTVDVVLVSVLDGAPMQCLREMLDIDWDGGASWEYVPLMAGPVQQARAVPVEDDVDGDRWACCGSCCAICTGQRGMA